MPLKTCHDELPQLNLTSMIDVVFLLIIFFMVAAKFSDDERQLDVRVPQVSSPSALTPPPQAREVAVQADGVLELDGQPATPAELTSRLAAALGEYPDLKVIIRGDAEAAFQHVAEALAACQEAGVAELAISVRVAQDVARARR